MAKKKKKKALIAPIHQIAQECSSLPRNYCQWPAGTGVDPCLSPCFSSSSCPFSSPNLLPCGLLHVTIPIENGCIVWSTRRVLYACNPSHRGGCAAMAAAANNDNSVRLHSRYGPLHYTVFWPGLFFLFFFQSLSPFFIVHFLRRVS